MLREEIDSLFLLAGFWAFLSCGCVVVERKRPDWKFFVVISIVAGVFTLSYSTKLLLTERWWYIPLAFIAALAVLNWEHRTK